MNAVAPVIQYHFHLFFNGVKRGLLLKKTLHLLVVHFADDRLPVGSGNKNKRNAFLF